MLAAGITVFLMFLLWEGIELRFGDSEAIVRGLHYARGISSSLVVAMVVGILCYRQQRRRAERLEDEVARRTHQLRETEATLRTILDGTPSAMLVLDRDCHIVQANQTAQRVHQSALVGEQCFDALAARTEPCEDCPARVTLETGTRQSAGNHHIDPRTGEVLAIETLPLDMPDGDRYTLVVERVVTEQKKLQARLIHQEKMAAFGLLAAGIAHDMGNPLSSLDMYLQLMEEGELPESCAPMIETMQQETARLRRILRELVDFARRRGDEAELVSIQSVVEDALRLLRHDPRMRAIDLETEFDPEAPPVRIVEDHLMQVVLNVLINALDAMPEGGELRIDVRSVQSKVVLRVRDAGAGMDAKTLAHCFEPLFTTKEPGKGTGLGLSISKDILDDAGGSIELHSAVGRGTTAIIELPEYVPSAAALSADSHEGHRS